MDSKTICSAVGSGWCLLSDRMLCFSVSLRGTSGQTRLHVWEMETGGCVWAWKGLHLASQTFQEIVSKHVLSPHDVSSTVPGGRDAVVMRWAEPCSYLDWGKALTSTDK